VNHEIKSERSYGKERLHFEPRKEEARAALLVDNLRQVHKYVLFAEHDLCVHCRFEREPPIY
jgi:hypothetical protein